MQDNQIWTPVQRPYVPCFPTTYNSRCICTCRGLSPASELRAEIQMMGKFPWAKSRQASEVIDLQALFDNYWISDEHELTVSSQSWPPTSPFVSDRETQRTLFSMEGTTSINGLLNYDSQRALVFVVRDSPSQPANNLGTVGISALVTPPARNIVKGILPNDERID